MENTIGASLGRAFFSLIYVFMFTYMALTDSSLWFQILAWIISGLNALSLVIMASLGSAGKS